MKTRLKTFPEKQNKSILENRNFLNSQNYILGKKEKKKILDEFFGENFFIKISNIIGILPEKINYTVFYLVFSIITFFVVFFLKDFFLKDINLGKNFILTFKIFFSIFLPSLIITFIISIFYKEKKVYTYNGKKIFYDEKKLLKNLDIKKYFLTEGGDFFSILFFSSIILLFFIYFPYYIIFLVLFLAIFFYEKIFKILEILFNLKLLQILFFPILFIISIPYILYIYFINLFLKKINNYRIVKKQLKTKKIFTFEIINKNYGENKYYEIEKSKLN